MSLPPWCIRTWIQDGASGDWGELEAHDRAMNEQAVHDGNMILSQYRLGGEAIWIISDPVHDAGERITTVLLPEER